MTTTCGRLGCTCGCWRCTDKAWNDGTLHGTTGYTTADPLYVTEDEPWSTVYPERRWRAAGCALMALSALLVLLVIGVVAWLGWGR